jgi:polyphenol oxidase
VIDTLELPGGRAVFSTRRGGVSEGPYESLNLGLLTDDAPDRVAENRGRLARAASVDAAGVVMGWQVHGTDLREWRGPDPVAAYAEPGGKELPRVDGHLTERRGLALLVMVADCYPVALCDGERAAMLHCGWRPLAGGIVERAIATFDAPPAAAVGPGIGGCCYEVGLDVAERFAAVPGAVDGRMLDLRRVISAKLAGPGCATSSTSTAAPAASRSSTSPTGATKGRQGGRQACAC